MIGEKHIFLHFLASEDTNDVHEVILRPFLLLPRIHLHHFVALPRKFVGPSLSLDADTIEGGYSQIHIDYIRYIHIIIFSIELTH